MTNCQEVSPTFQHVQPGPENYAQVYLEAIDYLNRVIKSLAFDADLHVTHKIGVEFEKAADSLAILRLEHYLFADSNPDYRARYGQRELVTQIQALLALGHKLSNACFPDKYRANMAKNGYDCSSQACASKELQEACSKDRLGIGWTWPAVRAAIGWAESELEAFNAELASILEPAKERLTAYLDTVDITDRFASYRRNLGCLSPNQTPYRDIDLARALKQRSDKPLAPRWHLSDEWTRAKIVGTQNHVPGQPHNDCSGRFDNPLSDGSETDDPHSKRRAPLWNANPHDDPRKMAGIEIKFPGRSEYQDVYGNPRLAKVGHSLPPTTYLHASDLRKVDDDHGSSLRGIWSNAAASRVKVADYTMNPTPDYLKVFQMPDPVISEGRDGSALPNSEYTDSYRRICEEKMTTRS